MVGAGRGDEPAVAGDMVGVVVGLENMLDLHAEVAGEVEVLLDVQARVDDGGDAGRSRRRSGSWRSRGRRG